MKALARAAIVLLGAAWVVLSPRSADAAPAVEHYEIDIVDILSSAVEVTVVADAYGSDHTLVATAQAYAERVGSTLITTEQTAPPNADETRPTVCALHDTVLRCVVVPPQGSGGRKGTPRATDLVLELKSTEQVGGPDLGLARAPSIEGTKLRLDVKGRYGCIHARLSSAQDFFVGGGNGNARTVKVCRDKPARIDVMRNAFSVPVKLTAFASESLEKVKRVRVKVGDGNTKKVVARECGAARCIDIPVEFDHWIDWAEEDLPVTIRVAGRWPITTVFTYKQLASGATVEPRVLPVPWAQCQEVTFKNVGTVSGKTVKTLDVEAGWVTPDDPPACDPARQSGFTCPMCEPHGTDEFVCTCQTPPPRPGASRLILSRSFSVRIAGSDTPRQCSASSTGDCPLQGVWPVGPSSLGVRLDDRLPVDWVVDLEAQTREDGPAIRMRCAAGDTTGAAILPKRKRTLWDRVRSVRERNWVDLECEYAGQDEGAAREFAELPPAESLEITARGDRMAAPRPTGYVPSRVTKQSLLQTQPKVATPGWRYVVVDVGARIAGGAIQSFESSDDDLVPGFPAGFGLAGHALVELKLIRYFELSLTVAGEVGMDVSQSIRRLAPRRGGTDHDRERPVALRWAVPVGLRFRRAPAKWDDAKRRFGAFATIAPTQVVRDATRGHGVGGRVEGGLLVYLPPPQRAPAPREDYDFVKIGIAPFFEWNHPFAGETFAAGRAPTVGTFAGWRIGAALTFDVAVFRQ